MQKLQCTSLAEARKPFTLEGTRTAEECSKNHQGWMISQFTVQLNPWFLKVQGPEKFLPMHLSLISEYQISPAQFQFISSDLLFSCDDKISLFQTVAMVTLKPSKTSYN